MKIKPYVDNYLLEKTIRDDAYLTREQRYLLLLLKSHRNPYTLDCCPKTEWLQREFGRSYETIHRTIRNLEKQDYLISVRRGFDNPNNHFFATDFKSALIAYHCPHFPGDQGSILRANRKRWAVKNPLFDRSGSVIAVTDLNIEVDFKRLTKKLYDAGYRCPHCQPQNNGERNDETIR